MMRQGQKSTFSRNSKGNDKAVEGRTSSLVIDDRLSTIRDAEFILA